MPTLPNRYNPTNIIRAFRQPKALHGEFNKIGTRINGGIHRQILDSDGIDIPSADWDTLIIFDACRFDTYEQEHHLPGELSKVRSQGSHSSQWLKENFEGRQLHDTVYVSPNAYAPILSDKTFHAADLFADEAVDESARAILPETVTDHALTAHHRYPNKRLIIHYMQPHVPYIGETGRQIPHKGPDPDREGFDTSETTRGLWTNIRYGLEQIEMKDVKQAYRENLRIVQNEARKIVDTVDGKTVISADHGNLFGERLWPIPILGYGHPRGIRHSGLIEVPWHELPSNERREIESDPPVTSVKPDQSEIESRLEALGYR